MENLPDHHHFGQQDQGRFGLAREIAIATPRPVPEKVIRNWIELIGRHGQPIAKGLIAGLRDDEDWLIKRLEDR